MILLFFIQSIEGILQILNNFLKLIMVWTLIRRYSSHPKWKKWEIYFCWVNRRSIRCRQSYRFLFGCQWVSTYFTFVVIVSSFLTENISKRTEGLTQIGRHLPIVGFLSSREWQYFWSLQFRPSEKWFFSVKEWTGFQFYLFYNILKEFCF